MPSWGINIIGFFFLRFLYFYFAAVVSLCCSTWVCSLVVASGGCSPGIYVGFSSSGLLIAVASVFLAEYGLQLHGFSSCSTWLRPCGSKNHQRTPGCRNKYSLNSSPFLVLNPFSNFDFTPLSSHALFYLKYSNLVPILLLVLFSQESPYKTMQIAFQNFLFY